MVEIQFDNGVVVFFKLRDHVKKALFVGSSLEDLKELFFTKFPDVRSK
jgi:hypothetical protein